MVNLGYYIKGKEIIKLGEECKRQLASTKPQVKNLEVPEEQ